MKIFKEDKTYLFPERNQKVILVENDESTEFIKCLSEYFGKKRKTIVMYIVMMNNQYYRMSSSLFSILNVLTLKLH